ncbi:LytR/AlgR family response regulator transcription factor [Peribacillus acanthi]|uniref:LytR/AlgR family response regulator transcription factor n=1 Tax=Peribacillus acanthi TaxID=2171554 RepID=UPI000D3E989E|nr:LytTR family DNA-binding domain-containing protein [Peribacillus acanthi]
MKKINVLIADDDQASRFILSQFTRLIPDYEIVGEAGDGEEMIKLALKEKPDLVLVDINMPYLNGFEAVRKCLESLPSLQVIFTTGHDDLAVEAFNISAVDYLVKPIERFRLFTALEKAKKMISLQRRALAEGNNKFKRLSIKTNHSLLYLPLEDIFYIERDGKKSILHTSHGKYETSESLQELGERLPSYFYKSHRSYLVNLKKIVRIESFGETFLAFFNAEDLVAHISKLKINDVYVLMGT